MPGHHRWRAGRQRAWCWRPQARQLSREVWPRRAGCPRACQCRSSPPSWDDSGSRRARGAGVERGWSKELGKKPRTRAGQDGTAGTFITSPTLLLPYLYVPLPRPPAGAEAQAAPMHHARYVVWGNEAIGDGGSPGGCGDLGTRVTTRIGNGKALPRCYFVVSNREPRVEQKKNCSRSWYDSSSLGRHVGSGPAPGAGSPSRGLRARVAAKLDECLVGIGMSA